MYFYVSKLFAAESLYSYVGGNTPITAAIFNYLRSLYHVDYPWEHKFDYSLSTNNLVQVKFKKIIFSI